MATDVLEAAPPEEPAPEHTEEALPDPSLAPARAGRRWAVAAVLVLTLLTVVAGGIVGYGAATFADEYDGRILPSATVAGVEVGGLTTDEAVAAVEEALAPELDRTIEVRLGEQGWETTPAELGATSDVEEAVAEALAAAANPTLLEHARMRWLGEQRVFERDVTVTHSPEGARAFVDAIAAETNRAPTDARVDASSGWVELVAGRDGLVVDTAATGSALYDAVTGGGGRVDLVTHPVAPDVGVEDFGQVLLLRQLEHRLYLYEGGEITHSWNVAVGTGDHPTPVGEYTVTLKRFMPTWINPSPNGWGAGMPARIGPGVNNPLGVRAINWDAPAIRFHGTANVNSIGTDASKGCVRLTNTDVVQLFDLVREGAKIVSLRA